MTITPVIRKSRDRKPQNYRPLLQQQNAKTTKGEKLGYLTGILYFAPATEAGRVTVCAGASDGCIKGCLFLAGRGAFPKNVTARIRKTHFFFDQRQAFIESLRYDIRALIRRAARLGMIPAVRINGTSDIAWLALQMAREFPQVQFYDYTKLNRAWERTLPNYHLTFSHSETNEEECKRALAQGLNVAVVFDTKKTQELPGEFYGARVVDGDEHDLRFLDGDNGVIIGLRAKGPAKKDCSGFVVKTAPLVQISAMVAA